MISHSGVARWSHALAGLMGLARSKRRTQLGARHGPTREMRLGYTTLLATFILCGCHGDDRASSRVSPRIVERHSVTWASSWGPGYYIEYVTGHDLSDIEGLRIQAESVWTTQQASVESAGACVVQLRASTPVTEIPVPGHQMNLFGRRKWDFVLFRRMDGDWIWLSSNEPPASPCTPKGIRPRDSVG